MMKILQTIAGFGAHSGGTSTCTYDLISALHQQNADVDLLTLASRDVTDKLMGHGQEWIMALENDEVTPFGYSKNMSKWLKKRLGNYDVLHTNGLWMYVNHATCVWARQQGKPYVITPHGMLYPAALHRSYWKKWPMIQLFFKKDIMNASCLHVTCRQEMQFVREFGYKGPVALIANPVVLPTSPCAKRTLKARKAFGFLGRLHPIKKVENLFYGDALMGTRQDEFEIWIMGGGLPAYEEFLKSEVKRLGLKNVKFLGFVNGQEKYERLAQLSALFVPSDFENFGMIVTEALSVGTPVMASLGTPWEDLNTYHCGWWKDRKPEDIAEVMKQVLDMPQEDLDAMGERGNVLVKEKFASDKVAKQMMELYTWLLHQDSPKPDFVYEL